MTESAHRGDSGKKWMVIKPRAGWFDLGLPQLWKYRDLILLFLRRDIVAVYKQTVLGPLWFVIQPLLVTVIFTVVFGNIARISSDGIPHVLFYFSGLVLWNYFGDCLRKISDTYVLNAHIFGKVYFPRLTVPVSIVLSSFVSFLIQFVFLLALMAFYAFTGQADIFSGIRFLFALPLLLLITAMLGLGFGIIVTALTTKYRDLRFLVTFGVQLAMYLSPVIFPVSSLSQQYKNLIMLNPMSSIIEAFRYICLGTGSFDIAYLAYSLVCAVTILLLGIVIFNRVDRNFIDII